MACLFSFTRRAVVVKGSNVVLLNLSISRPRPSALGTDFQLPSASRYSNSTDFGTRMPPLVYSPSVPSYHRYRSVESMITSAAQV